MKLDQQDVTVLTESSAVKVRYICYISARHRATITLSRKKAWSDAVDPVAFLEGEISSELRVLEAAFDLVNDCA